MGSISLVREASVLVVIDLQPSFLKAIHESDRVVARSRFLIEAARILSVPVIATTQNRERMGGIAPELSELLPETIDKMSFSCCGSKEFRQALEGSGRRLAIIVGIETHICVSQTAQQLRGGTFEVAVCPDAVSSRSIDRHKLGMERIRDGGAIPVHSEAVVYEWLRTAEDPAFREILALVKANP